MMAYQAERRLQQQYFEAFQSARKSREDWLAKADDRSRLELAYIKKYGRCPTRQEYRDAGL